MSRTTASAGADAHFYGLGITGRFGNQHIQYMVLRALERIHGITIRFSPWIGDSLYERADHLRPDPAHVFDEIDTNRHSYHYLTRYGGQQLRMDGEIDPQRKRFVNLGAKNMFDPSTYAISGRDIYHDAYVHTGTLRPQEAYLRSLFTLRQPLRDELQGALAEIRRRHATLVVLHVRNDDFVLIPDPHFASQTPLYDRWLEQHLNTLERPYVYLCGQPTPRDRKRFERFGAHTIGEWPHGLRGGALHGAARAMAFDHFMARQADHFLCSNSTFAFSAAMLNERGGTAYRADLERGAMRPIDPWNAPTYASASSPARGLWQRLQRDPLYGLRFLAYLTRRVVRGQPLMQFSLPAHGAQDPATSTSPSQAPTCRQT